MGELKTAKAGDVFDFRYTNEFVNKYKKEHLDLYHCFDGQLIAKEGKTDLYLEDTYWSSDNRKFTISEALEKGTLEFKFNIYEVENIESYYVKYFDAKDIFTFHTQHGCRKNFVKRINATRSKDKMISEINTLIANETKDIEHLKNRISDLKIKLEKVNDGDLSIYF